MTEKNALKMNLDHERKIVELQSRVNKLENLCYMTKEVLNLEEASDWVRGARAMSEEEIRLEAANRLNEMNNRP